MAKNQGGKGNPASHRMGNAKRKAKFARCWENSQKRKAARRKRAEEAAQRNRELRAQGLPTPWEAAKQAAQQRRAETRKDAA